MWSDILERWIGPPKLEHFDMDAIERFAKEAGVLADPRDADDWFQTFSGRRIYLDRVTVDDICLEDVAHSLPSIARYGGQARRIEGNIYSVGEHSILIAQYAKHVLRRGKDDVRHALFHDAAEAYTGDIKRPIKNRFPGIRPVVRHIEEVVADFFQVPAAKPDWLTDLDLRIIADEKSALMCHPIDGKLWGHEERGVVPLGVKIRCLPPDQVTEMFHVLWQEVKP